MPQSRVNDPKHWRDRAAEMRALAVEMTDAEARAMMLRLAHDYDSLADRKARRNLANAPSSMDAAPALSRAAHR
jgi:hypothetical protein